MALLQDYLNAELEMEIMGEEDKHSFALRRELMAVASAAVHAVLWLFLSNKRPRLLWTEDEGRDR